MRKILLPAFLILLVLFAFTACDDDDNSKAYEIVNAILDACDDAYDDGYYTYSVSGIYNIYTYKKYTCTETSRNDGSDISVTIKSGSTQTYVYNNSKTAAVGTYDIDATVDGTSRTLYLICVIDMETWEIEYSKIELDGVDLM